MGLSNSFPILTASAQPTPTLESSYTAWITRNRKTIAEMQRLEEENNRLFIDCLRTGRRDSPPDVPIEQITLTVNPAYRYGGKRTAEEQWILLPAGHHERVGLLRHRLHDGPLQSGLTRPHLRSQWRCRLRRKPLHHIPSRLRRHRSGHRHRMVRRRCSPPPHWVHVRRPGTRLALEDNLAFLASNLSTKEERAQPRDPAPLPLRPLLQGPSADLQEAPHLLALRKRQAEGISDASSTCTATTKAHWPGCVPST